VERTAPLILDIAVVLLVAAFAGWASRRVGLPAVIGYLAVGLLVSPFTPGYVADRQQIWILADIGVVLLLFEVGIEIDLSRITREHKSIVWLAPAQVFITTLAAGSLAVAANVPPFGAALLGLGVALSSSVVVVNITRSRRRTTDQSTEQALLGWSVLQDVVAVALAAVMLAVHGFGDRPPAIAIAGFAVYGALVVGAAWALPRILRRLRSEHDLFLIMTIATGLLVASLGSIVFAIPLALAAFVAGIAVTEGAETAEARRRLLPFRDVFAVLFFVAIGSLIDPLALGRAVPLLAALVGLVVAAKVAVVYILARLARLQAHHGQLAVGLGQVGEFSFVLASVGQTGGVISDDQFAAVLGAVVLTIAGSAVLARRIRPSPAALAGSAPMQEGPSQPPTARV
jgi:CPA2 family monovalent cation:H+ antiporter-2